MPRMRAVLPASKTTKKQLQTIKKQTKIMALIEKSKLYLGNDLENIFFRPLVAENGIQEHGIRVLYNMPMPTTIHLWSTANDVLKPYTAGWQGGSAAVKQSKTLELSKVKAESAFSASDYYARVYEHIIARPDVNLQDLTGTDLEAAETEIFKRAIADGLRITTWIGDTNAGDGYNTFDGILRKVQAAFESESRDVVGFSGDITASSVVDALCGVWNAAPEVLKSLKKEGELAFFVSSSFYRAYEEYVYQSAIDNNTANSTEGYTTLYYRGIPLVDIGVTDDMLTNNAFELGQCLLTDRRNLVLALNTSDYPDAEVRMWYNPDQMENRQRAVFLASADFLDLDLISLGHV